MMNSIFNSVPVQYRRVFDQQATEMLKKNLTNLQHHLAIDTQDKKTIFIVHDLSNGESNEHTKHQIIKINTLLKLSGLHTIIDLVDLQPGCGLTIHQFMDKMWECDTIMVIDTGKWDMSQMRYAKSILMNQVVQRNKSLILLTIGVDQSSYKYGGFESLVNIECDFKGSTERSVIETCELITKTYEIVSKLYGDQNHQLISEYEASLNAELMSISTDQAQLNAMLRNQEARDQRDLDELQIILGLAE